MPGHFADFQHDPADLWGVVFLSIAKVDMHTVSAEYCQWTTTKYRGAQSQN
jgi:hypothetical protein